MLATLFCYALPYSALLCIALALHCFALVCSALICIALHRCPLLCIALPCFAADEGNQQRAGCRRGKPHGWMGRGVDGRTHGQMEERSGLPG